MAPPVYIHFNKLVTPDACYDSSIENLWTKNNHQNPWHPSSKSISPSSKSMVLPPWLFICIVPQRLKTSPISQDENKRIMAAWHLLWVGLFKMMLLVIHMIAGMTFTIQAISCHFSLLPTGWESLSYLIHCCSLIFTGALNNQSMYTNIFSPHTACV